METFAKAIPKFENNPMITSKRNLIEDAWFSQLFRRLIH